MEEKTLPTLWHTYEAIFLLNFAAFGTDGANFIRRLAAYEYLQIKKNHISVAPGTFNVFSFILENYRQ